MNCHPSAPDEQTLRNAFRSVYDPEFGVSIEDLGLIYGVRIEEGVVFVSMTLTSMYCPAGDVIVNGVKAAAEAVPGVVRAEVDLVWEPLWTPELLSREARRTLGWEVPQTDA